MAMYGDYSQYKNFYDKVNEDKDPHKVDPAKADRADPKKFKETQDQKKLYNKELNDQKQKDDNSNPGNFQFIKKI